MTLTSKELKETLETTEGKQFFVAQIHSMGKDSLRQALYELTTAVLQTEADAEEALIKLEAAQAEINGLKVRISELETQNK
ncbi:hypothetical protein [Escherichia phage vB_EcoP_PAS59]|uniref:Uncharacterized protein n=2 Tax=Suseptimavirus TaxID=3044836 RepID=A0AA51VIH0_9CAUD|nr:hypothetical protein PQC42_gp063 [Escherichia phage EK010]UYE89950.1 hypothetical protein [Escherichia phage E20-1]WMX18912.1 hypothetical protein [Escherichia phage vB_EcoP_PAS59]BCG45000.1 hypothetical protein [Escherichia phage EK010]